MANLGYGVASIWTPRGVVFGQWATFNGCALVTMAALAIGLFVWYVAGHYRSIRILQVPDVFRQRIPWLRLMLGIGVAQVVFCLVLHFIFVRRVSFESVIAALATGIVEGTIGMVFYWLCSIVGVLFRLLPPRVKYVPWPGHWVKVRSERAGKVVEG